MYDCSSGRWNTERRTGNSPLTGTCGEMDVGFEDKEAFILLAIAVGRPRLNEGVVAPERGFVDDEGEGVRFALTISGAFGAGIAINDGFPSASILADFNHRDQIFARYERQE
jgi:hypothetical protein